MKRFFAGLFLLSFGWMTNAQAYVYFHTVPTSVQHQQSYQVGATFLPSGWYGGLVTIWKVNSQGWHWLTDAYGYSYAEATAWTSDSGPQTVEFIAEGYDYDWGNTYYDYASVVVSGPPNDPPVATVLVDGQTSGATVIRPGGGSVNVTVRFKATDANGNLSGIRPNVWDPATNLNNNGGAFVTQSGSSGEVVWTVTLNQNGNWYFWTDAQDSVIAPNYVDSGSWTNGFRLNVVEANAAPVASISASTSSILFGQATTITGTLTDTDGNLYAHGLLRQDGAGWRRPPDPDYVRTGWNGFSADTATIWFALDHSNDTAAGGSSTKTASVRPPVGSWTFRTDGKDGSVWSNGANVVITVGKAVPAARFPDRTIVAGIGATTYQVQAGDLNAEFANPYSASVSPPSGTPNYTVVEASSGATPTSGAVSPGTTLSAGTFKIRASLPAETNYEARTIDSIWTVLLDSDGDEVPNGVEDLFGTNPQSATTHGTAPGLKIHRPNQ